MEVAAQLGRAFHIDVIVADRRLVPVVITVNVRSGVVEAHARIQCQVVMHCVAVHHVCTEARILEVRDDESPSAAAVMLVF